MKREEVIKRLETLISEECGLDFLVFSPDEIAEMVLKCVEEAGMLPPWTAQDKKCYCSMLNSCPGCSPNQFQPKWE